MLAENRLTNISSLVRLARVLSLMQQPVLRATSIAARFSGVLQAPLEPFLR